MSVAIAAQGLAWVVAGGWKKIAKYGGYALLALAVCYSGYRVFNMVFEMGQQDQLAKDKILINDLNKKLAKAEEDLASYKDSYAKWQSDGKAAEAALKQEHLLAMEKIRGQLDASERTVKLKQALINEIGSRIPDQAAGTRVDLNGFVGLYNEAIQTGTSHAVHYVPGAGFEDEADPTAAEFASNWR